MGKDPFAAWEKKSIAERRKVLYDFGINEHKLTDEFVRNLSEMHAFELWQVVVRRKLQENPHSSVTERPGLKAGTERFLRALNNPPMPPKGKRRGPRKPGPK